MPRSRGRMCPQHLNTAARQHHAAPPPRPWPWRTTRRSRTTRSRRWSPYIPRSSRVSVVCAGHGAAHRPQPCRTCHRSTSGEKKNKAQYLTLKHGTNICSMELVITLKFLACPAWQPLVDGAGRKREGIYQEYWRVILQTGFRIDYKNPPITSLECWILSAWPFRQTNMEQLGFHIGVEQNALPHSPVWDKLIC